MPRIHQSSGEGAFCIWVGLQNLPKYCNPRVLEESPKMLNSQKWLGEGAKGGLSSGSKSLPRVFCTIRNPFRTGATPFCTGATPFSLPGLKRPFAPSPNHFWEFTIFGLSTRTFGLQPKYDPLGVHPGNYSPHRLGLLLGKESVHRPAPVKNFLFRKKMGATEERFWW